MRTAPVIDKKFKAKYSHQNEMVTSRQIALGVRKRDKARQIEGDPFEEEEVLVTSKNEPSARAPF